MEDRYGIEVLPIVADGADEEAIKSVVSQTVEKFGKLGQASYAAAKEGIRGLSRVAASEWGPYEVRVNVVCPLAMTENLQGGSGLRP